MNIILKLCTLLTNSGNKNYGIGNEVQSQNH